MSVLIGTHRATQEREYLGYRWFFAGGNLTPVFAQSSQYRLIQGQQVPLDHPLPRLWPGVVPGNVTRVLPGNIPALIRGQNVPLDHPQSRLGAGVQGPNVRVPVTDRIQIVQEQPDYPRHPLPRLWFGIPPVSPAVQRPEFAVMTRQELPWHPSSQFWAGHFPVAYEERQFFIIA